MTDNKPEVTDPAVTDATSKEETIRMRIAEGKEQNKADFIDDVNNAEVNQKVVQTSGGTTDVSAQGGSSNSESNVDSAALKLIEASTGRKFENPAAAEQFLKNLNSLVGDQQVAKAREAEKVLAGLTQKFGVKDVAELEKYIADQVIGQTSQSAPTAEKPKQQVEQKSAPTEQDSVVLERLEKLEHRDELLALREKYPNAVKVAEEVALIAKAKGVSYIEAYEGSPLRSLVELQAKEESSKNPIVAPSNRTNIDYRKAQELVKRISSGRASEEDQIELVKMALGDR